MSSISVTEINDVRLIEVIGRLDGDSSPEMGRAMDQIIDQGHNKLVLDLGSVEYLSSPGLREIVRIYKRVQGAGGDLRLANPSEPVMTVMELAGLDTLLQIHRTRTAAINSF